MLVLLFVYKLVFVMRVSSELATLRRARNLLCGVACGWEDVLLLLDCLRRYIFAFLKSLCELFLHDLSGV